eukprot:Gb_28197 [translate_table: standard]
MMYFVERVLFLDIFVLILLPFAISGLPKMSFVKESVVVRQEDPIFLAIGLGLIPADSAILKRVGFSNVTRVQLLKTDNNLVHMR